MKKKKIIKPIVFIIIIGLFVKIMPFASKYNIKIKFSIYRSIMCCFFVIKSIIYLLNTSNILKNAFIQQPYLIPLLFKFCTYISFDIIYTLSQTKKRYDLLFHHIIILIIIIVAYKNKCIGNILPILLLNESISIVSGFDTVAMNNNKIKESIVFKKIRKMVIFLIRLPLWLLFINLILKNEKFDSKFKILLVTITISILGLDLYWYKKCSHFIYKNRSS
tara:strand:+ start:4326 stop:4985 length:660 start_codon:yes stop_codon:yes gene_type:complete